VRRTKLKLAEVSIGGGERMWCLTWPKPGTGRNRQFFRNKAEAKSLLEQKRVELENFGRAGMQLSDRERALFHECCEALRPYQKSLRDATTFYVEHLKSTSASCTAVQLVQELLKAKKADGVSEQHLRAIRYRLNAFAEKFDGQPVATITSRAVDIWLRSLPVASLTRNHYRQLVVLMFNFAVRNGYATTNPAIGAAKAKVDGKPPGILTVKQASALLVSAAPEIVPYVAIGLFAGLRRAELERLDWSEINFESGLIEVTAKKSKTAMRRLVKIQPNLREWLLPYREHKGNVTPASCFRELLEHAREAAGINEWPVNALRHSFASYHMARFANAAATALELGHTDAGVTFRYYRELVEPKEAERYWQIAPKVGFAAAAS
jgi:integrase